MNNLLVTSSPHIRDNNSTAKVMTNVIFALCPALIASGIFFGGRALMLTGFCMLTAMLWERLCNLVMKRPNSTGDLSAAVTGMLIAMNLPVTLPYWMAGLGTFIAIVIVKQLFGGLGHNFANPAIVGRIVLVVSFPAAMTNWAIPFYDTKMIETAATPLVTNDTISYAELFLGKVGGCLGETSACALLLGGVYLVAKKIISPATPLAFIGTVCAFSYLTGRDGLYQILAGSVMIGAIFMATDYVTTPITTKGKIFFGVGCGLITCIIRFYGSYPEGVSFSILIMNILTPYIDMFTKTKPIGAIYEKEGKADEK